LFEEVGVGGESGDAGDAVDAEGDDHDAVGGVVAGAVLVGVAGVAGLPSRARRSEADSVEPATDGLGRKEPADGFCAFDSDASASPANARRARL
jgi:hypothetical protein